MIHKNDEFLHEFKKNKNWIESFHYNFVSNKHKIFGGIDIDYNFSNNKVEFSWVIIFRNKTYVYSNSINFNGKLNNKKITDNKFEYSIVAPLEKFKIVLKNESLLVNLNISGVFPIYDFPENIVDEESGDQLPSDNKSLHRYEQRCQFSGNITIKTGEDKGKKMKFDCFGQREHLWGNMLTNNVSCQSRITVQFRDMAINLTYIEKDAIPASNGFLSRKSGNIPILNVECESLSKNNYADGKIDNLISTEFSYKDAQDDVDLLVGKTLYSVPLPLPHGKQKKYVRFRNFSEFTIIGTNKKGHGVEDHYISKELLELIQNSK